MIKDNISKKTPRVSVVMAIYKEPVEWMKLSIDSILNQSFRDFEFIIVNDNPSRIENHDMLDEYTKRDCRIIVITNEQNIGLTKSLNKGLEIARGKYIARMDADDISMPERFEKQFTFLENNLEIDVCGSFIRPFGKVSMLTSKEKRFPRLHGDIVSTLLFENPVAHPVVMIRRCIADWYFRYNEAIKKAQDYYLWYDLYIHGAKFHNLQLGLLNYRISNVQISSTSSSDQLSTADMIHKELLSSIGITEPFDIDVHNEICRLKKNKYSLEDKTNYLIKLHSLIRDTQDSGKSLYIIKKYSMLTCLVHKKFKAVFCFPYVKVSDIFSKWFIREFVKSLIGKL